MQGHQSTCWGLPHAVDSPALLSPPGFVFFRCAHIRCISDFLSASGLKTPEEIQQENILRQAWDMEGSPFKGKPFDPNILKPQSFGPGFPEPPESHAAGI